MLMQFTVVAVKSFQQCVVSVTLLACLQHLLFKSPSISVRRAGRRIFATADMFDS